MKKNNIIFFYEKLKSRIALSMLIIFGLLTIFTNLEAKVKGNQEITKQTISQDVQSANSIYPPIGRDWIQVKIPLSVGYYSTADSQHKNISSNMYKIDNLSDYPVKIELSGFVGNDGISNPIITGIRDLSMVLDTTSISLVTNGISENFNDTDKSSNLYILGSGSTSPASGNFKGQSSGVFSFTGATDSNIDIKKELLLDNQLNFTLTGLDGDGNIPSDKTTLEVHDIEIKLGNPWNAEDNYDQGKNELGNNLSFDKVVVSGDIPDINNPGVYTVSYNYRDVTKTAKVIVSNEISFMNQTWDIIKGPNTIGKDNYLIAMQNSIGKSKFSNLNTYYISDTAWDGYQDSIVKPIVEKWYSDNISGTVYENNVLPIILPNPKFENMKILGWTSHNSGEGNDFAYLQINQPGSYPTMIDDVYGTKKAFLMSGSDVSNGNGPYGQLSYAAIDHLDKIYSLGIGTSWLRTPGYNYQQASVLYPGYYQLGGQLILGNFDVVPSLVVHLE